MATVAESLRILVVATRDFASEVRSLLVEAGFAEPTLGDGGDETFGAYEEVEPHVVLLGAHLERGDSRSLAAAMKGGDHGHFVRVILLGETDGPIRNALDAADFEVDRFLARPLAAKALAYAVHSCGAAALKAHAEGRSADEVADAQVGDGDGPGKIVIPAPSGAISLPPSNDPTEELPTREPTLIVGPGADVGQAVGQSASAQPLVYESKTSPRAIADAIDAAIDEVEAEDDPPDEVMAQTDPRFEFAAGSGGTSMGSSKNHSLMIDEAMEAAIAEFVSEAISSVQVGLEDAGMPSDGVPVASPYESTKKAEAPAASVREPTLILSPGAASASSAPSLPADESAQEWPAQGEVLARDSGLIPSDDELLMELDADERRAKLDDLSDLDDLDGDDDEMTVKRAAAGEAASPKSEVTSSSGAVARELRRKMSAMAERLFPGQVAQREAPDAFSLPHDANTEIDFSALESGQTGVLGKAFYRGIGRVETFADTNPLVGDLETKAIEARTRFAGELGAEHEDIATLLARLHLSNFSGTVNLTRDDEHKTINYDAGRPVFASSTLDRDRMGDLLFREGKISRAQHRSCNEELEGSGRRMGELLVQMGFLKPRELLPAVRRHIEDIFYSAFGWERGDYEVLDGEPSGERIRLSRHPAALVVEGVRRKYSLARLIPRLGDTNAILAPTDPKLIDSVASLADLTTEEELALAKFDGSIGLEQIAKTLELDRLTVTQLGFTLVALGAAEIVFSTSEDETGTESGRSSALVGETDIAIDRQRVLAKLALVEDADYFMLLGVRRDASRFEILRAYEAARRDYASESFPEPVRNELASELETINELIEEAFMILGNDSMRSSYLQNIQ